MLTENPHCQQLPLILDNKPLSRHCYPVSAIKNVDNDKVSNSLTGTSTMFFKLTRITVLTAGLLVALLPPSAAQNLDAAAIIKAAMDQWRGTTSHSTMTMTIHRPDWQRSMTMEAWTAGEKKSLVRVLEPKKDAGNGTLLIDNSMWTFSPKVNRVIKIPSSMMNQSWMGSDFSNKDIARSADIIDQYKHTLIDTQSSEGHKVYVIQSVPKEAAPVVWGKLNYWVRQADYLPARVSYFDEDGTLIRHLDYGGYQKMNGRKIPTVWTMHNVSNPGRHTEIRLVNMKYDIDIPDRIFSFRELESRR